MTDLCQKYGLSGVTFAVHTLLAEFSPDMVEKLFALPKSTITFWGESDAKNAKWLSLLDQTRIYIDTKPITWILSVVVNLIRFCSWARTSIS